MSRLQQPIKVFVSSPGDLSPQRAVIQEVLQDLNTEPAVAGRFLFVPYVYENVVPARAGYDPQDVVNSYLLRPEDADIFLCMFWLRMGTPMKRFIDPATNAPYLSGTYYEFMMAYQAAQHQPTPIILFYRCIQPAPAPDTREMQINQAERQVQIARVEQFFERFNTDGDLRGLVASFADDAALRQIVYRDLLQVLHTDLEPLFTRRAAVVPTYQPTFFGLPPLPNGYIPRPEALEALRKAVLGSHPKAGIVAAAALHGIGGLGKTVLARALCDDPTIRAAFPDGILWATVGQTPNLNRLQREWIRPLGGDLLAPMMSDESGRSELQRLVGKRRMLLILDDVWQATDVRALEVAGEQVRTLITTRDANQVSNASLVPLELMRQEECLALLRQTARNRVPEDWTLKTIANRVGQLPLALQIVGQLLARGFSWRDIVTEMDMGRLAELTIPGQRDLFEALDTSVRFLPVDQQARYHELVIFPKNEPFTEGAVIRLWHQTGNLSTFAARRLFYELRDRSLIQMNETLHDLQYDYLTATSSDADRRHWHTVFIASYGSFDDWSSLPDDAYAWRWFPWHLSQAGRASDLRAMLLDATYLENKISRVKSAALISDFQLVADDADIGLVTSTIALSHHVLDETPSELPNQIMGRAGEVLYQQMHHWPEWTTPHFQLESQTLIQAGGDLLLIMPHTDSVHACAFSPDGRYALSDSGYSDTGLRLWEVTSGEARHTFQEKGNTPIAFSPDGQYVLSASKDATLRLWRVQTGEVCHTFIGHTAMVLDCAFSADGRYVLSASEDTTLRLWQVQTGEVRLIFVGHTGAVTACAFSPDGRYALSASTDHTLRLWEVQTGQIRHILRGHTDDVLGCVFSPDGRYVLSISKDTTLRLWETQTGEVRHTFQGTGEVRHTFQGKGNTPIAFSPDGRYVLSASSDHTLRLWEVQTGEVRHTFVGHTDTVRACAFSPDGRYVLSASHDTTLRLWEVQTGEVRHTFIGHTAMVLDCAFSPDGRYVLSASHDTTLRLWQVQTKEFHLHAVRGHSGSVTACAFSPDGRYALSASKDTTLRLWDVQTKELHHTFVGHTNEITACAFSPDGRYALSASKDTTLRLWDVQTGEVHHTFVGHTGEVTTCAYSPDGRYALSASSDHTLRLWDVNGGELWCHTIREFVTFCAFSPDGRYALGVVWSIVSKHMYDNALCQWEVETGKASHTSPSFINYTGSGMKACAFSPNGRHAMVAMGGYSPRLWLETSEIGQKSHTITTLQGHVRPVVGCAFSSDSRYALSASDDRSLRLWDVATGRAFHSWAADTWSMSCVATSQNGMNVIAGDTGGNVHFLKIEGTA